MQQLLGGAFCNSILNKLTGVVVAIAFGLITGIVPAWAENTSLEGKWKALVDEANSLHDQGRMIEAGGKIVEAMTIAGDEFGRADMRTAETFELAARIQSKSGMHDLALQLFDLAYQCAAEAESPIEPRALKVLVNKSPTLVMAGRSAELRQLADQVLNGYETILQGKSGFAAIGLEDKADAIAAIRKQAHLARSALAKGGGVDALLAFSQAANGYFGLLGGHKYVLSSRWFEAAIDPADADGLRGEEILLQSLQFHERIYGVNSGRTVTPLSQLASHFATADRNPVKAEAFGRRALALVRHGGRMDAGDASRSFDAVIAALEYQGKLTEATALRHEQVAVLETIAGTETPLLVAPLKALARSIEFDEPDTAIGLIKRAITVTRLEGRDESDTDAAILEQSLLDTLMAADRWEDAIAQAREFSAKLESGVISSVFKESNLVQARIALADSYRMSGQPQEAVAVYRSLIDSAGTNEAARYMRQSLEIRLGDTLRLTGNDREALAHYRVAYEMHQAGEEIDHYPTLAALELAVGEIDAALATAREGSAQIVDGLKDLVAADPDGGASALPEASYHFGLNALAAYRALNGSSNDAALVEEGFTLLQRAQTSLAAQALNRTLARAALGDTGLGELLRQQTDRQRTIVILQERLNAALADVGPLSEVRGANLRKRIAEEETAERALGVAIQRRSAQLNLPAIASPIATPLSLSQVQRLLRPDEALLAYQSLADGMLAWAVTREAVKWVELPHGEAAIEKSVAGLRCGLDPRFARGYKPVDGAPHCDGTFDLELAHRLYRELITPLGDAIEGKRHWILMLDGPMTALPIQLLVRGEAESRDYRRADWLIRHHTLSVLPSLTALRGAATPSQGLSRSFIGFGDPVLGQASTIEAKPAELAGFYRNRGLRADPKAIAALASLPETAYELRAIASHFPPGAAVLRLGAQATESVVKSTDLGRFGTISFATHGLVGGEMDGVSEPALVLTPPAAPSDDDDGLLTASEVARLRLDADWVILSACNTASGRRQGAESLSGLAQAFLHAGARSLLVSHWPVNSEAAVMLSTGAFAALSREPWIGKAEAMRRSMLAMIEQPSNDLRAHPAYWAPFVLIGTGR